MAVPEQSFVHQAHRPGLRRLEMAALTRRRALVCSGGRNPAERCERTAHLKNMPCGERTMP